MPTPVPFTQGWEDAKNIVGDRRVDSTTIDLYKRFYNIIYTQAIPQVQEFEFLNLKADWTPIHAQADHVTGTCTVVDDDATVEFSSATLPTSVGAQWKFKLESGDDNDDVYEVSSRTDADTIELARTFIGTGAASLSFVLYQDIISLPSNFDRFPNNPRIWYYRNGAVSYIELVGDDIFQRYRTAQPGTPRYCRLHPDQDSNGYYQLQFDTGWDEETLIYGEYIRGLDELTEYVTGTVAVTNASTTWTGTGTVWNTNVAVGDYIRVDSDSKWYRVTAVGGATDITAVDPVDGTTGYRGSTASGKAYTVAKVPVIPVSKQNVITYGICAIAAAHQDDQQGFSRWQRMSGIPEMVLKSIIASESRVNYGTQRMRTVYERNTLFGRNTHIRRPN